MDAMRALLLVFSNATEGRDEEFNAWYDEVHVPEVLAVEGVVAAQRFDVAELELPEVEGVEPPPPPVHRYLAVYELDRDGNEVMASFGELLVSGAMTLSETLDMSTVSLSAWNPR
jgi:hypothetical protein